MHPRRRVIDVPHAPHAPRAPIRVSSRSALATLGGAGLLPLVVACSGGQGKIPGANTQRFAGQSDYASAPLPGNGGTFSAGGGDTGVAGATGGASAPAPPQGPGVGGTTSRAVEETDIYRVDGDRLYYLNAYRGLMVFDVTNVDQPKLLGRSPIFGDPQEMVVQNGMAVVVVGDWYGTAADGTPFHGSIARGLDCRDPAHIADVGDAYLGGYVRDTRVVGKVLYTVAQDYGWEYGWGSVGWGGAPGGPGGAFGGSGPASTVRVASIDFADGTVRKVAEQAFPGDNGIFNVTPTSILLAMRQGQGPTPSPAAPAQTTLQYIDITDPGGAIRLRGSLTIAGAANGWGADEGRWNLDFADGVHAHMLGCTAAYCGGGPDDHYALTTVDFSNPDAPKTASTLDIGPQGWSVAARFDVDPAGSYARMYLSPSNGYRSAASTPLSIYDLTVPAAPKLAGSTTLDGQIWLLLPNHQQLFALGSSSDSSTTGKVSGGNVEVQYVDVTQPSAPHVLGSTQFGSTWSWSPASDTFKAFVVNSSQGLAAVPFSGWDGPSQQYFNGVELVGFSPTAITTTGTARTKGWVERGIFVKNRLVSLSDQALAVVDYTQPNAPKVVRELTLARNVVDASPQGATIAELSSDWWGNDSATSEMRVLPIADAAEATDESAAVSTTLDGVDARVFRNGTFAYVVTDVNVPVPCGTNGQGGTSPGSAGPGAPAPSPGSGKPDTCTAVTQEVEVVDLSNGAAKLRGKVVLPLAPDGYPGSGLGWQGFGWQDWYNGADVVQVGGDALAFRRWLPGFAYGPQGATNQNSLDALYVVDASNPDAPSVASLTIAADPNAWWGDMNVVGSTLYTTHLEYLNHPSPGSNTPTTVRYYLDRIDLTDRAHPRIGTKVNVPGALVGASSQDPHILYFADYRWDGVQNREDIATCELHGDKCYLQSTVALDGYAGNVIVQNSKAYMTVQPYEGPPVATGGGVGVASGGGVARALSSSPPPVPHVELHMLDLTNPRVPVDHVTTDPNKDWGWLLGVVGDRAVVTSGWGQVGVDIYRLSDAAPPAYDESVRTLGWGANSIARQGSTLYLASGYWGVQPIDLQ